MAKFIIVKFLGNDYYVTTTNLKLYTPNETKLIFKYLGNGEEDIVFDFVGEESKMYYTGVHKLSNVAFYTEAIEDFNIQSNSIRKQLAEV